MLVVIVSYAYCRILGTVAGTVGSQMDNIETVHSGNRMIANVARILTGAEIAHSHLALIKAKREEIVKVGISSRTAVEIETNRVIVNAAGAHIIAMIHAGMNETETRPAVIVNENLAGESPRKTQQPNMLACNLAVQYILERDYSGQYLVHPRNLHCLLYSKPAACQD